MPIIKSAKKRVRVAERATIRNVKTKRGLRQAVKAFQAAVTGGSKTAGDAHAAAQSALDKALKKGIMHKNKVARKKKQLAAQAKAGGMKTTTKTSASKPETTKKTPSKKPVVKKSTTAKKPVVTKKAPAKRPTAKKTAKK